jgi:hypothetical protein
MAHLEQLPSRNDAAKIAFPWTAIDGNQQVPFAPSVALRQDTNWTLQNCAFVSV